MKLDMLSGKFSDNQIFFVTGVARSISESSVEAYFSVFGDDAKFVLERDREERSLGYGWLRLSAIAKIETNNPHYIDGKIITVTLSSASNIKNTHTFRKLFCSECESKLQQPVNEDLVEFPVPSDTSSLIRGRPTVLNPDRDSQRDAGDRVDEDAAPCFGKIGSYNDYVCIPLSLCPASVTLDPRVSFAVCDSTCSDELRLCPPPWLSHLFHTGMV